MRIRLTPASVRKARANEGADRTIFWDDKITGFGLQVTAAGHKSFVVQYRARGHSRRMTIGDASLNLEAARKRAKALIGEVAHDRDPLAERRAKFARERDSFQAIAESYFAREGKKLRTGEDRRQTLVRLVYPLIGARPIADVRRSDLVGRPGQGLYRRDAEHIQTNAAKTILPRHPQLFVPSQGSEVAASVPRRLEASR